MGVAAAQASSGLKHGDSWLRKWVVAARVPFLPCGILPVVVGTAAAWRATGQLALAPALLAVLGIALIHAGVNLANDYFDHRSGTDVANRSITPFSGGSRVIQQGVLSARAILHASLFCFATGSLCGIGLWLVTGSNALLAIGVFGVALGWCYTAPPLRLSHRGLGELAVWIGFALPVLGAECVQRGTLSLQVSWLGFPAGILVAACLVANEFPDMAADGSVGKRTLVVRLGRRRAVLVYVLIEALLYGSVGVGVAAGWFPVLAAIVVLAAPLSWRAIRVLSAHYDDVPALIPAMAATVAQQAAFLLLLTAAFLADLAFHGMPPAGR